MNNTTKVGLGLLGAGLLLTIAGAIEARSEEDFLSDDDCCSCPPICEPPFQTLPDHIEPPFIHGNTGNLTLIPTKEEEPHLIKPVRLVLLKR